MMRETTPRIQRTYRRFEDAGHGAMRLSASLAPPAYDEPVMVLLLRGVLPAGRPASKYAAGQRSDAGSCASGAAGQGR